jgi:hypothetical protein
LLGLYNYKKKQYKHFTNEIIILPPAPLAHQGVCRYGKTTKGQQMPFQMVEAPSFINQWLHIFSFHEWGGSSGHCSGALSEGQRNCWVLTKRLMGYVGTGIGVAQNRVNYEEPRMGKRRGECIALG